MTIIRHQKLGSDLEAFMNFILAKVYNVLAIRDSPEADVIGIATLEDGLTALAALEQQHRSAANAQSNIWVVLDLNN